MYTLSIINNFIKYFFLIIISFYVFFRSTNNFNFFKEYFLMNFSFSLLLSFFHLILSIYFPNFLTIFMLIAFISIIVKRITGCGLFRAFFIATISFSIALASFIFSIFVSSMVMKLPFINLADNNPIILIFACILESFLIVRFFNIKRFSKGLSFLNYLSNINNSFILGLLLSINLFILYCLLNPQSPYIIWNIGLIAFALIIIASYIWIKRSITLDYRERMRNREIDMLKEELETEKEKNIKLNEELNELAKINHKYSSRIKASEESVKKLAYMFSKTNNTEFSDELSDITKLIGDLSSQYSSEIASKLRYAKKLPSTNVKGVDIILSHMQKEALDNNIDFELKINCSVNHLIEKYIPQGKLETLLGDHIKDAIIAINSGNNKLRKIYVIFDIIDNCYQISFYDSGIDFEINTLINLGLEAITTHKDTGGNGFGFLTTFQTLKECKASLIIEEINFKNSNFSKCIHILFDNNSRYVIKTNRLEDFKKYNISDRIILEDTKTTS